MSAPSVLVLALVCAAQRVAVGGHDCRWSVGVDVLATGIAPACSASSSERDFGLPRELAPAEIPPTVLVKTHKTGSSTLANILNRMGDRRNLRVMTSEDLCWLGWPGAFPGLQGRSPAGQFDMITSHAVYNRRRMEAYMASAPFFLTILREPGAQGVSAFNYYNSPLKAGSLEATTRTWEEHVRWLEDVHSSPSVSLGYDFAHFVNPQAFDLGWYEHVRGTTAFDGDQDPIQAWLNTLDRDFGKSGAVLLSERFDESLVLLRRRLGLDLRELAYASLNVGSYHKVASTEERRVQVRRLNQVDVALYTHFNRTFHDAWALGDAAELAEELAELRRLTSKLGEACSGKRDEVGCPVRFTLNPPTYMAYFIEKTTLRCLGKTEQSLPLFP